MGKSGNKLTLSGKNVPQSPMGRPGTNNSQMADFATKLEQNMEQIVTREVKKKYGINASEELMGGN